MVALQFEGRLVADVGCNVPVLCEPNSVELSIERGHKN